jgi:hypothetical protein
MTLDNVHVIVGWMNIAYKMYICTQVYQSVSLFEPDFEIAMQI